MNDDKINLFKINIMKYQTITEEVIKKNEKIIILSIAAIISYVFISFIFAIIYFGIYRNDNSSFIIKQDIIPQKRIEESQKLQNEIDIWKEEKKKYSSLTATDHINILKNYFKENKTFDLSVSVDADHNFANYDLFYRTSFSIGEYSYIFDFKEYDKSISLKVIQNFLKEGFPLNNPIDPIRFENIFNDKKSLSIELLKNNVSIYPKIVSQIQMFDLEESVKKSIEAEIINKERKKSLIEKNMTDDIWSLNDFFYFSATSMFGGGYGEFTPNSSQVRSIIILNSIICWLITLIFGVIMSKNFKPKI